MHELVTALMSQVGVTQAQAQGGAGAIFKAAHDRLGTGQFDQLFGNIAGIKDLLAHAPSAGGGGLGGMLGGMFGGLASLASKMGGSDMAQAAQLLAAVSALGINKDTLMKFIPVVMQFLESKGGPQLVEQVRAALKL